MTVICSDKTGTLTENRMTVTVLDLAGHRLDLDEEFRHGEPVLVEENGNGSKTLQEQPALALLLAGGALSSDAILRPDGTQPGHFHAVGDPTEGALVVAAARFGLWKDQLDSAFTRVAEVPFDSDRKRMTTVHRSAALPTYQLTNPPITNLPTYQSTNLPVPSPSPKAQSTASWTSRPSLGQWRTQPLDKTWRRRIVDANADLASKGMRVLGLAFRPLADELSLDNPAELAQIENDLTFVGLVGMIDPPRLRSRPRWRHAAPPGSGR